jgi:hypothetical protein
MVDVGGQKTERKKWIHTFECVEMVLFVASLNDFDLCMDEDPSQVNPLFFATFLKAAVTAKFVPLTSKILKLEPTG